MPRFRRRMALGTLALLAAAGLGSLALWGFQERLIYPAPHYGERGLLGLPAGLTVLRDPGDPASVVGFYREPAAGGPPSKLWLAFGGNGDLALRWDPILAPAATNGTGILMIEYPGYGARSGSPTPEALLAGGETTFKALAQHLNVDVATLEARTSVLGYSLGSAVALGYAALHPVRRIVLVSPFTSMLDMARRLVGAPLCHLLRHRYDNLASLRAAQERGHPPLTILHGAHDTFIPPEMGEALAAAVPGSHFELVPGAKHGDVVDLAAGRLRALLAE
jgi:pimeloyl-ACP methyl ester carboxylesterase